MATLRGYPYPYKALAGIHSDIDMTSPDEFYRIHQYLNTNRKDLPYYGEGLGLPLTSSIYFTSLSPANAISPYLSSGATLTKEQYETEVPNQLTPGQDATYLSLIGATKNVADAHDVNGYPKHKTPWADEEIPKFIKVGWIDFLHALTCYSAQEYDAIMGIKNVSSRKYAQKYLEWLQANDIKLEVYIGHYTADSNFTSSSASSVTVGNTHYWSDLALQAGLRFIEYAPSGYQHRTATNAGATTLISPATFPDGGKFWKLTRCYHTSAGTQYQQNPASPAPDNMPNYINQIVLDRLVNNGYMEIFSCHYGYHSLKRVGITHASYITVNKDIPEFPLVTQNELKLLKSYQDQGKILVATTRNICQYDLAKKVTTWSETTTGTGAEKIVVTNFNDSQFGAHVPTVEEIRGLTWYVNNAANAEIWINTIKVDESEIVRSPADSTGKQSIGIKWYNFTGEDYSEWTLTEVNQGYKETPNTITITSITLIPKIITIKQNETKQFTAQAYDELNNPVSTNFQWSVDNPSIATIDQNGLITALSSGTVTVTATAGGVTDTATVTIVKLSSIIISPQNITAKTNEQIQFTAKGYDQNGDEISFTPQWSIIKN